MPIPSNNKQSGELDYKLMLITINAQDHFFAVLCITDDYWYAYDGLASEPAVRMLNLPEDVNGSITLVVYLCFSLLITMASQSKISKHKLSEPNNAEKQVKQTKLCHSASKVEEKKKKKVPETKVLDDSRFDYTPRATFELVDVKPLWLYKEFDRETQRTPSKPDK